MGILQKSPSVIYDSLKVLHKYFNQVVVDEVDQTVDTEAYILHSLLSTDGRYVLVGGPKQLSCFSTVRLSQRAVINAALHWNLKSIKPHKPHKAFSSLMRSHKAL